MSPARARRRFAEFAAENGIADPSIMLLIVSELVTNAVQHGGEPIEMRLDCSARRVRIEVSDANADTGAVTARERTPDRPGGWGLEITERLSQTWGTDARPDGKTVWVEFDREALEQRSSAAHG